MRIVWMIQTISMTITKDCFPFAFNIFPFKYYLCIITFNISCIHLDQPRFSFQNSHSNKTNLKSSENGRSGYFKGFVIVIYIYTNTNLFYLFNVIISFITLLAGGNDVIHYGNGTTYFVAEVIR